MSKLPSVVTGAAPLPTRVRRQRAPQARVTLLTAAFPEFWSKQMRKFIAAVFAVAFAASVALAQSQQAPTLRIVSEDGNRLPSELMYGNTKVKPLRLRPGTNVPITIDDSDFFVQQHYVDFLSRFPDQSGFAFWQNDINQCGPNAPASRRTASTSRRAFFLSIEYQQTGYLVYKTYKAAFGDLAGQARPRPPRELHARDALGPERRHRRRAELGEARSTTTTRLPASLRPARRLPGGLPRLDDGARSSSTSSSRTRGVTPDDGRARRGHRRLRHGSTGRARRRCARWSRARRSTTPS